jgi:hypothetical protein
MNSEENNGLYYLGNFFYFLLLFEVIQSACSHQYNLGRPQICTGLWDCCGDLKQMSMYCLSSDARDRFPAKLETMRKETDLLNNANSDAFKDRTNRRRQELLQHIQKSQELKPSVLKI